MMLGGYQLCGELSRHERDGAQRTAGTTLDLHWQGDEDASTGGNLIQIHQVLESRHVGPHRDAVDDEILRRAVVDRRSIDPQRRDATLLDQQSRYLGAE